MLQLSNGTRWALRIGTAVTLAFIYVPLVVIGIYAFNESRSQAWPPRSPEASSSESGIRSKPA